jgi:energy-coupling factor transporter ATP-binding protein EcfA2
MLLRDVLLRDPLRPFERGVSLLDSARFRAELEEFVVTNDAAHAVEQILDSYAFAESPTTVWISGATGSGKSTLLKILAYLLGDVTGMQLDRKAVTNRLRRPPVGAFLDALLTRVEAVPATSLLFSGERMARTLGDSTDDALLSLLVGGFRERCCASTSGSSDPASVDEPLSEMQAWLDLQPDNYRLNFFIDDVDRFLGSSVQRMLELKASVESLMRCGRGRIGIFLASSEIPATTASGAVKTDLSKIQSRFQSRVVLTRSGIEEVIQQRLMTKSDAGGDALSSVYDSEAPFIRELLARLGQVNATLGEEDFIASYPFLPYQFYLLRDAIEAFADRGLNESREVSVIGAIHGCLAEIANEPLGRLAAVDDLLSRVLETSDHPVCSPLEQALSADGKTLAGRILTLLFALKFTGAIRPTSETLTALVCDHIGQDLCALAEDVDVALRLLEHNGHARRSGVYYEYAQLQS